MTINVLSNSIQRNDLDDFLKSIKKYSKKETGCLFKVSPRDTYSKFIKDIYSLVDDSYSFTAIRNILFIRTSIDVSIEVLSKIYGMDSSNIDIYKPSVKVFKTRSWHRIFIGNIPSLLVYKKKKRKYFDYLICTPGTPSRPITSDYKVHHPLHYLTMSWPVYDLSLYFDRDFTSTSLRSQIEKLLKPLFNNFLFIDSFNLKNVTKVCRKKDIGLINSCLTLYNSGCSVYSPEIHTIKIKDNFDLYINYSLSRNQFYFSLNRTADYVRSVFVSKNTLMRFVYKDKISLINNPNNCHKLARVIQDNLPIFMGGTSYYQIAFDGNNEDLNENTTLAYGHNTFKERYSIGKSQIYFYSKGYSFKIGLFTRGMALLFCDTSFKEKDTTGVDIIDCITNILLDDNIYKDFSE